MKNKFLASLAVCVIVLSLIPSPARATLPISGDQFSFAGTASPLGAPGGRVDAVVVGDLDHDGDTDAISASGTSLTVWQNDGTPFDAVWVSHVAGTMTDNVLAVAVADMNNNGDLDIVVGKAAGSGTEVEIWSRSGNPFADTWIATPVGDLANGPMALIVADLDNDGDVDIATGSGDAMTLWRNGDWAAQTIGHADGTVYALAVADLNHDGNLDLVSGSDGAATNEVMVWQNDGTPFDGAWSNSAVGASADSVFALAIVDLDADGTLDLVTGSGSGADNELVAWEGDGTPFDGGWMSHNLGATGADIRSLGVVDMEHDGDLDIAVGCGNQVIAFLNDENPFDTSWLRKDIGTLSDTVYALTTFDVDNDGDKDVLTGSGDLEAHELLLWENTLIHYEVAQHLSYAGNTIAGSPASVEAMQSADLDFDGDLDIVSVDASGQILVWENDGTPFEGTWAMGTVGTSNKRIMSLAIGDLDNDGDMDIVTGDRSDGLTPTLHLWQNTSDPFNGGWVHHSVSSSFLRSVSDIELLDVDQDGDLDIAVAAGYHQEQPGEHCKIWLWQNDGTPFSDPWDGYEVYTTVQPVNALAAGDLDGDGDLDLVAGLDRDTVCEGSVGCTTGCADPSTWLDIYQIRAYRNDGTPFDGLWEEHDLGRPPVPYSVIAMNHCFHGAFVHDVEVADFDNDGNMDIVSGQNVEADNQVIVWQNDGTPFSGDLWAPTTTHWNGNPNWLSDSVWNVFPLDYDRDGNTDILSSSGEFYQLVVWENDDRPFGTVLTDTTWIRVNVGLNPVENGPDVLSTAVGDYDQDGDWDVAGGSGNFYIPNESSRLAVWENPAAQVRFEVEDTAVSAVLSEWLGVFARTPDDLLKVEIFHTGEDTDHDAEWSEWHLRFENRVGQPLSSELLRDMLEEVAVFVDADGNGSFDASSDTEVIDFQDNEISLSDGWMEITFQEGDPNVRIPAAESRTFYLVGYPTAFGAWASPYELRVTFDPDEDALLKDRTSGASLSIREIASFTSSVVEILEHPAIPSSHLSVSDVEPDFVSPWVDPPPVERTLTAGESLTLYAVRHRDTDNREISLVPAEWSMVNVTGGITDTDLLVAPDRRVVTFTAHLSGSVVIQAVGSRDADQTSTITVIPGALDRIVVEDAPGGVGSRVITHSMEVSETLELWAVGYDVYDNYVGEVSVTWDTTGDLDPIPAGPATSAIFAPITPGTSGTITVTNGIYTATTGTVTVFDVPIAGLTATNDSPTLLGSTTTLTATVTAGGNVAYTWAFGDGEIGSGDVVTHTYATVGVHTAVVTATNSVSLVTGTTTITITDVPVAGLTAVNDSPTVLGDTTTFTATVDAGTSVTYTWAFGDGDTGIGDVVTHDYSQVGIYTALVTATNSASLLTATTTVTVDVGPLADIVIRDASGGKGSEVDTRTMTTEDSLTVYAAGYDAYGNYLSDVSVTWDTTGDLDTIPAGPTSNAIFAPTTAGTSGTITADDGKGHTGETGTITVISAGAPDLTIEKSGPAMATAGTLITFVITVTNDGDADAMGLVITDVVPSGAHYVSGGTLDANTVRWSVPSLATATSVQVSFVVTASQTITNSDYRVSAEGNVSAVGQEPVVTIVKTPSKIYLPIVLNKPSIKPVVYAPDLVVKSLVASSNRVQVVIQNVGNAPVTDAFWVDVYFDPSTLPELNQPWDTIASHGTIWGVTGPIQTGDTLTLTTDQGDLYYFPEYSSLPPLPVGADVYALVDSVNFDTGYGAVQEDDEDNNLFGPITSTPGAAGDTGPSTGQYQSPSTEGLPPR